MRSPKELQQINDVFVRVTKDNKLALKHGLVLREKMWQSIKSGVTPTNNYRYKWLLASANDVVYTLGVIAGRFDDATPGDMASLEDLKDILRMSIKLLEDKDKK